MFDKFELSDEAKLWLYAIGWTGGTIVLCYALYKWFAILLGKSIATELVKAGALVVL